MERSGHAWDGRNIRSFAPERPDTALELEL